MRDSLSIFPTALILFGVKEKKVVLIHHVFYPEVKSNQYRNQWNNWSEKDSVQENNEDLAVHRAQLEFTFIDVLWFHNGVLLWSLVATFTIDDAKFVRNIKKIDSIANKSTWNDKLSIKVLLTHQITRSHIWKVIYRNNDLTYFRLLRFLFDRV